MQIEAKTHITLRSSERAALIAILRPQSGAGQWIRSERYEVTPLVSPAEYVDVFGNLCQRFVMPKGKLELETEGFDATQKEPKGGRIVIAYGRDAADVAITTPFGPIEVEGMKVHVKRV